MTAMQLSAAELAVLRTLSTPGGQAVAATLRAGATSSDGRLPADVVRALRGNAARVTRLVQGVARSEQAERQMDHILGSQQLHQYYCDVMVRRGARNSVLHAHGAMGRWGGGDWGA